MNIVVFEDAHVAQLHPITLGRPAYAITCGAARLIDWLRRCDAPLHGVVRAHLADIQRIDYPDLDQQPPSDGQPRLLVNARAVPSPAVAEQLKSLAAAGRSAVVRQGAALAAALLTPDLDVRTPADVDEVSGLCRRLEALQLPVVELSLPLLEYPHDVIRYNVEVLGDNLAQRLASGRYAEIRSGVFAAQGAVLGEHVITETRDGPILLEENARVGPFCLLRGPAFLGPGARINEHAAIKDGVTIGHTTKVGGEVEATVIEPFTNKQHHGFLGHSYVGSWINLGAGTCNSDLKNTYGTVNMVYGGRKTPTGMQFVGCIMGDYAKTAINTGIFTGKTIGACSMLYGFVTTNVPSFVNYARLFGQVSELPPEVMIATQRRMFERRQVGQRPCDIQLIHDMYELTRGERQVADDPLTL